MLAKQVTTGIQSQDLIEILTGLRRATRCSGSYRAISKDLANGSPVKINNNAPPADKPEATASRE